MQSQRQIAELIGGFANNANLVADLRQGEVSHPQAARGEQRLSESGQSRQFTGWLVGLGFRQAFDDRIPVLASLQALGDFVFGWALFRELHSAGF